MTIKFDVLKKYDMTKVGTYMLGFRIFNIWRLHASNGTDLLRHNDGNNNRFMVIGEYLPVLISVGTCSKNY